MYVSVLGLSEHPPSTYLHASVRNAASEQSTRPRKAAAQRATALLHARHGTQQLPPQQVPAASPLARAGGDGCSSRSAWGMHAGRHARTQSPPALLGCPRPGQPMQRMGTCTYSGGITAGSSTTGSLVMLPSSFHSHGRCPGGRAGGRGGGVRTHACMRQPLPHTGTV